MSLSTIGRRKKSVAKVVLAAGTGKLIINRKQGEEYFQFNPQYIDYLKGPLVVLGIQNTYDIYVETRGGGLKGQAGAIRLSLSRVLAGGLFLNPCGVSAGGPDFKGLLRPKMSTEDAAVVLRQEGFLTRDSRCKERKKYGLKKARKAPQFSKR
jgi:small subunit ribosomal protein S9